MLAQVRIPISLFLGATAMTVIAGCPLLFPTVPTDPAGFTNANQVRGGQMYDKWWAAASLAAPTGDHPLWASRPDTASNTRSGTDTWRCKECHGWDYVGVSGAYSTGSHRTGVAGIRGTTKTAQEVFDLIKTNHGMGAAGLSDADIWDLTKFVLTGTIDTTTIIDSSGNFNGSTSAGKTLYDNGVGSNIACVVCHGADGKQINFAEPPEEEFVGDVAGNPWEFQHKVRFGQPGTAMPSSINGGGSNTDVADIGAHAATFN